MIFETLYSTYSSLAPLAEDIFSAYSILLSTAKSGGLIMCCGNGGSAADSEHIVGELMKGFVLRRPLPAEEKKKFTAFEGGEAIADKLQGTIRAVSLVSQTGLISAFANDIDASLVYAQQVWGYTRGENDTVILLSTSGNSLNVVNAAVAAKAAGAKTVALTGEKESRLSALCDITIKLPSSVTFEIQELMLPVYHALCAALEEELFGKTAES